VRVIARGMVGRAAEGATCAHTGATAKTSAGGASKRLRNKEWQGSSRTSNARQRRVSKDGQHEDHNGEARIYRSHFTAACRNGPVIVYALPRPSDRILMSTDSGKSADVICSVLAALHSAGMTTFTTFAVKHSRTPPTSPVSVDASEIAIRIPKRSSPKLFMIQTRCAESPEIGVHWRRRRRQLVSYAALETSDGRARAMASKRSVNQVSRSVDRCLLL
jgi:hypothetical protein